MESEAWLSLSETVRWLRPWMAVVVALLVLATVLTAFAEDMPEFHHVAVPAAALVMAAAWAVERIALEIVDNGLGFEPSLGGGGGFGLAGIRERAQRLGGTVQIDSAPGAGTCVRVEVPRHALES